MQIRITLENINDLYVSIKGEIETDKGRIVDLKLLDSLIKKEVIDKFDHRNQNHDTLEFKKP